MGKSKHQEKHKVAKGSIRGGDHAFPLTPGRRSLVPHSPPGALDAMDRPKMTGKEYQRALRHLQGELVALQEWVKGTGENLRRVRRPGHSGKGRHHQGDHSTGEPSGLSCCCPTGTNRTGAVSNVCPALCSPFPGSRRGGDLRPKLVQPRRCGTCHGVLFRRPGAAVPRHGAGS